MCVIRKNDIIVIHLIFSLKYELEFQDENLTASIMIRIEILHVNISLHW